MYNGDAVIHFENMQNFSYEVFGNWLVYVWYYGNPEPLIMYTPNKVYDYILSLQAKGYKIK